MPASGRPGGPPWRRGGFGAARHPPGWAGRRTHRSRQPWTMHECGGENRGIEPPWAGCGAGIACCQGQRAGAGFSRTALALAPDLGLHRHAADHAPRRRVARRTQARGAPRDGRTEAAGSRYARFGQGRVVRSCREAFVPGAGTSLRPVQAQRAGPWGSFGAAPRSAEQVLPFRVSSACGVRPASHGGTWHCPTPAGVASTLVTAAVAADGPARSSRPAWRAAGRERPAAAPRRMGRRVHSPASQCPSSPAWSRRL